MAAPPQEVSLSAKCDRTLAGPRSRDLESLIVEALQAQSSGDLEEAIRLYSDALRLRLPNQVIPSMIYNHRGIAHLALARLARSIRDFNDAVRWNSENFRAYLNRGLAHLTLGKWTMALRDFGHAVGAHEVEGDARYAIAQVLVKLGRGREARAECDKALALKPNLQGAKALMERLREA